MCAFTSETCKGHHFIGSLVLLKKSALLSSAEDQRTTLDVGSRSREKAFPCTVLKFSFILNVHSLSGTPRCSDLM